jgi:Domain of unknown function (DUF4386)
MLTLILVAIPIAFLNDVNSIAALVLVRGAKFLSSFDKTDRDALALLLLNLRGSGFDAVGIFWGLWLLPLGLLVYHSGFISRISGRPIDDRLPPVFGKQCHLPGAAQLREDCIAMGESSSVGGGDFHVVAFD